MMNINDWDLTVGLEIHAQLSTKSKLFSSAPVAFANTPNSCVSVVDLAMPGTLPVVNKEAIYKAIRAGLALQGSIDCNCSFDRKHYSYPDLPQGYQITQFFHPIMTDGKLDITTSSGIKTITIRQMHIEQDAGKSIHDNAIDKTYLDFNRCGVPLVEIVTNPDFHTIEEVAAFLEELRRLLRYVDASNADMEKGSMRCDANVSISPKGSGKLGTRCEIKNLNSIRNIGLAIQAEIYRQIEILNNHQDVIQSTCLFNEESEKTFVMRTKEDAEEYFYFQDGDLPRIDVQDDYVENIRKNLPKLPKECFQFLIEHNVDKNIAKILVDNKDVMNFVMNLDGLCDIRIASNWLTTEIFGILVKEQKSFKDLSLDIKHFAEFITMIVEGKISSKIAKEILLKVIKERQSPQKIVQDLGYEQINDTKLLEEIIDKVLLANPGEIDKFKAGKHKVLGFFVGQVMKNTKGQGNPKIINDLLLQKLK